VRDIFCTLCDVNNALEALAQSLEPGSTQDALAALVARLDAAIDTVLDASLAARQGATP
jgi:hypothetical protein